MAVVKRRTLTRLIVFCAALGAALLSLRILRRPLRHTTHAAAGASADARLGAYDRAAVEFAPPRRRAHSAAPTPRAFAARAVDRVVLVARIAAAAGNASGLLPPQARAVLRSLFPQNALPELTSTDASWTISLDNSPVGLSVMLTCIDFGHACEPTCPANYKQHKNSIVSLIPIGCPKQIANVSSDIFDSWVTALETAPEHSHLLFVDESVVGFEKNWLHEMIAKAHASKAAIVSGALSYGRQTMVSRTSPRSGWIQNAGISFRMAGVYRDWIEVTKDYWFGKFEWYPKVHMPVPINYKQGFESGSFNVIYGEDEDEAEKILGVTGHIALVSVNAVKQVGGLNSRYLDPHLSLVDVCLKLDAGFIDPSQNLWRACVFHGKSVAIAKYFDYDELYIEANSVKRKEPEFPRLDIETLFDFHKDRIMKSILKQLWINERISVRYDSIWGDGGCGGWASEILPYLVTLESRVFSMSITSPDTWCSGLYPAYRDTLDRLRLNPIPHIPSKKYPFIYIKHSQGEFALEQIQMDQQHFYIPKVWFPKHVRPTLFISRTMTETNTIIKNPYFPRGWSNGVDQVWVPAPFLKRVFVESGETGSSGVRVAKETVDLARFDPESKRGIVGVWDLRWLRGARWAEWITKSHDLDEDAKESRDVMSTLSDERGFASNREAMFIPEPNDPCQVIFLSVFKWEPRKDPESLLRSFFQTFGLDSGVCLLISTKVSGRGLAQEEVHNHDIVYENILRIASSVEWVDWDPRNFNGKTIQDSNNLWESRLRPMRPPRTLLEVKKLIKISTKERAWDEVPSLYKIADAYVSASHGEGWGLPVHEALAMKLPVIASATTGHNAFLDHETAWPVELELDSVTKKPLKLPVPEEARMDFGPKAAWDLVNWKHLSNCMLDVAIQKLESYQDRDTKSKEIHTKPLNARRLLMKKLSPEVVMKEWAMMLAELVEEKVWN